MAVVAFAAGMAVLLFAAIRFCLTHDLPTEAEQRPEHILTHEPLAQTYTQDGGVIRLYVVTDPDYGTQYVVDEGGHPTPRIGSDGRVVGTVAEDYGGDV